MTYYINQKLSMLREGKALAEVADGAGIARGFLSDLEGGKKSASLKTVEKLAAYFDIPVDQLINGEDDTPLSNAVRHVTIEYYQKILERYSEEYKDNFQKSCLYEDALVHPYLITLLKNIGYSIGEESVEREAPRKFFDKHKHYSFISSRQLKGISLSKGRHKLDIQLDELLEIQKDVEKYVLFLLYRHADQHDIITRVRNTKK